MEWFLLRTEGIQPLSMVASIIQCEVRYSQHGPSESQSRLKGTLARWRKVVKRAARCYIKDDNQSRQRAPQLFPLLVMTQRSLQTAECEARAWVNVARWRGQKCANPVDTAACLYCGWRCTRDSKPTENVVCMASYTLVNVIQIFFFLLISRISLSFFFFLFFSLFIHTLCPYDLIKKIVHQFLFVCPQYLKKILCPKNSN